MVAAEKRDRFVIIRVLTRRATDHNSTNTELVLSQHIAKADPKHEGFRFVRTVLESFEIQGQHGQHLCLVYVPMRESMSTFQRRTKNKRIPPDLFKVLLKFLLQALDYLHTKCDLIHTGTFVSKLR